MKYPVTPLIVCSFGGADRDYPAICVFVGRLLVRMDELIGVLASLFTDVAPRLLASWRHLATVEPPSHRCRHAPKAARQVVVEFANVIFAGRDTWLWGTGATVVASDSTYFRAGDQDLLTEWHSRYRARGVLAHQHVEFGSMLVHCHLGLATRLSLGGGAHTGYPLTRTVRGTAAGRHVRLPRTARITSATAFSTVARSREVVSFTATMTSSTAATAATSVTATGTITAHALTLMAFPPSAWPSLEPRERHHSRPPRSEEAVPDRMDTNTKSRVHRGAVPTAGRIRRIPRTWGNAR